jgi:hypothetical protein
LGPIWARDFGQEGCASVNGCCKVRPQFRRRMRIRLQNLPFRGPDVPRESLLPSYRELASRDVIHRNPVPSNAWFAVALISLDGDARVYGRHGLIIAQTITSGDSTSGRIVHNSDWTATCRKGSAGEGEYTVNGAHSSEHLIRKRFADQRIQAGFSILILGTESGCIFNLRRYRNQ